jgi:hypothetical protein
VPELTDENIEDLFADLRADELHRVRPPGAAHAYATVRWRRTTASIASGFAVLAVIGVTATALNVLAKPNSPTEDTTAGRPPLSEAVLGHRRDLAAAAIGLDEFQPQGLNTQMTVQDSYVDTNRVLAGTYTVKMACVGTGTITVPIHGGPLDGVGSFHRDGAQLIQTESVPCGAAAIVQTITIAVVPADNGFLAVGIHPDAAAKGQAGFAYRAELSRTDSERLHDEAQAKLAAGEGKSVTGASGFLESSLHVEDTSVEPGKYRLELACVGIGAVSGIVWGSPTGKSDELDPLSVTTVDCLPGAAVSQTTFIKKGGTALRFSVQPDDVSLGRAAAAYRLIRV